MLKDVLYNSKVLNELFTEDDFSFLNESDEEVSELNRILKEQKINREHIINFINNFKNIVDSNANAILTETQEAFELVNANINDIYNLQEQFQQLEKMIVECIVDLENGNSSQENISEIKSKINTYSSTYKNVKDKILFNDTKIRFFLSKINIHSESKIADREIVLNSSNFSDTKDLDDAIQDNLNLLISEKQDKVFLPYTRDEILAFMKKYPNDYSNAKEVIEQEFIVPVSTYSKHPSLARFREAYSLIRDREMKSIMDAFKYAIDLMFKYELNPAIVAACKSEKQLETYLQCLESNKLDDFKYFTIKFEVSPFAMK